jgi:hypothetical protein
MKAGTPFPAFTLNLAVKHFYFYIWRIFMKTAATEAVAAPAGFIDINTVAAEAESPCRPGSNMQFFLPNFGIFTTIGKNTEFLPILNQRIEVITIELFLNSAHRIKPGQTIPNCTNDAVQVLAAKCVNIEYVVPEPVYVRDSSNRVTSIKQSFIRRNPNKSATLGIRVKFEENVFQTANFNPKRASGTVSFP